LAVLLLIGMALPFARAALADAPPAPRFQTAADAARKSAGCVSCHTASDQKTMHESPAVILGCTDCHGGDASIRLPDSAQPGDVRYRAALDQAHIQPRLPGPGTTRTAPIRRRASPC